MDYKQFFETLNENIHKSTTERALKNLERVGENYVKNVLKTKDNSMIVKRDVRVEMNKSRKLIRKMKKKIRKSE